MTNQQDRRNRISIIFKQIQQCTKVDRPAIKKKLIANFTIDTGIRKAKVQEYIQVLLDAELIEEKEDGLWIKTK